MQKKKLLFIIFLLYIAVILRMTVFRSSFGQYPLFQNGNINLTLFQEYIPLLRRRDWYHFIYLFVGNIIWFVPFGMYFQYTEKKTGKRMSILLTVLLGFLLSLAIEISQYIFGTGITELDDLVLNTFGVWLGAIIMRILKRIR